MNPSSSGLRLRGHCGVEGNQGVRVHTTTKEDIVSRSEGVVEQKKRKVERVGNIDQGS